MRQKIASITQWWRLPAVCVLCHHYHQEAFAVCKPCVSLLVRIEHGCNICRLPLMDRQALQCGHCIKSKPAFDQVLSSYSFEEPLRTLLHEFKYQEALCLRTLIVELMMEALPTTTYKPNCLVPVPMHPKRLRERGFNQAAELAKLLSKRIKVPLDLSVCEKKINTVAQVNLNSKQRVRNLQKAFVANPNAHHHITLIDDLLTTGSTANALATALKKQGVARVDVWCLARTPGD